MSSPLANHSPSVTRGSVFEALFVRALQPGGRFAEELRAAGYDVGSPPRAEYPTQVWRACVEVARRHTFPRLPQAEGERRLGGLFLEGFLQTLAGKLLSATLPMLGTGMVLQKLQRAWSSSQPNLEVSTAQVAERHWRVTLREEGVLVEHCAGLLEGILRRTRVQPEVKVLERSATHCVLDVRWSP